MDLTDLNITKYYSLPWIEKLVYAIVGHELCYLVDAIVENLQILVEEYDAKQTAFITDEGVLW